MAFALQHATILGATCASGAEREGWGGRLVGAGTPDIHCKEQCK